MSKPHLWKKMKREMFRGTSSWSQLSWGLRLNLSKSLSVINLGFVSSQSTAHLSRLNLTRKRLSQAEKQNITPDQIPADDIPEQMHSPVQAR